jgi:hypothetical protein
MSARTFVTWLWLVSSVPVGIALMTLPPEGRLALFTTAVVLDMAHSVSPIAASWGHSGFRRIMLADPWRYLGLPIAVAIPTTAAGVVTSLYWTPFIFHRGQQWLITDWRNPFPIVVWVYFLWNAYHFGMQNFGVLSLVRGARSRWQRTCDMTWCMGLTLAAMRFVPDMVSFNHWITEIGLTARVSRHWVLWFVAAMMVLGLFGFAYAAPRTWGQVQIIIPWIICLRFALGFWHFLQDRWMWKLGDPQVRATIGQELFASERRSQSLGR